jgi:hypothetical protein
MANKNEKEYVSNSKDWSNGATWNVDLSFLESAKGDFQEPEIYQIDIRFNGSITTANDGTVFTPTDAARLLQRWTLGDRIDPARFDFDGIGMLYAMCSEIGAGRVIWPAQQAANVTNASYEAIFSLFTDVGDMLDRPRDCCPHVKEFLCGNGGKMSMQFSATNPVTGVTINSGTFQVVVYVREGRSAEAGPRLTWKRHNQALREDNYPVNGSLRTAFAYSYDDDGAGVEDMSSYTYFDSTSLDAREQRYSHIIQRWARQVSPVAAPAPAAGSTTLLDPFYGTAPGARPFRLPRKGESILDMPDLAKLHLKLDAAVKANQQVLICSINDRDAVNTAEILGISVDAVGKAPAVIPTRKGKKNIKTIPRQLRGRVPVRLGAATR